MNSWGVNAEQANWSGYTRPAKLRLVTDGLTLTSAYERPWLILPNNCGFPTFLEFLPGCDPMSYRSFSPTGTDPLQ